MFQNKGTLRQAVERPFATLARGLYNCLDCMPAGTLTNSLQSVDAKTDGARVLHLLAEQFMLHDSSRISGPRLQHALNTVARNLRRRSADSEVLPPETLRYLNDQLDESVTKLGSHVANWMADCRKLSNMIGFPEEFEHRTDELKAFLAQADVSKAKKLDKLLEAASALRSESATILTVAEVSTPALKENVSRISQAMHVGLDDTIKGVNAAIELSNRIETWGWTINSSTNINVDTQMLSAEIYLQSILPRRMYRAMQRARLEDPLGLPEGRVQIARAVGSLAAEIKSIAPELGLSPSNRRLPVFHMNQVKPSGSLAVIASEYASGEVELALATPFGRVDCALGHPSLSFPELVQRLKNTIQLVEVTDGPRNGLPLLPVREVCLKPDDGSQFPVERNPENRIAPEVLKPLWKKAIRAIRAK